MKECGDCAVCCFHCNVPEMNSPAKEMCEKNTGTGCTIYEERPDVCRSFECLWLSQDQIPDSLRPDICGIMFEQPYECKAYIGFVTPGFELLSPWENEDVKNYIYKINQAGNSVVILAPDGRKLFSLGKGETKAEMHDTINHSMAAIHDRS